MTKVGGPSETNLSKKRLLVVDDHKFIRALIGSILGSSHAEGVEFAEDGASALQLMRTAVAERLGLSSRQLAVAPATERLPWIYDCVITDFNMDPVNGLELLKNIRRGDAFISRDTPVILLTGHSEARLISTALALDVNAFVLKPVSRDGLVSRLGRIFNAEFVAQKPDAYSKISIPDAPNAASAPLGVDASKDQTLETEELRNIDDVKFGSVLARHVRGDDGAIILARGTSLTGEVLIMLKDLRGMKGLDDGVWIRI